MNNKMKIIKPNVSPLYVDVADDVVNDPLFFAAEASIFTSETPSITPFCFSSTTFLKVS